MDKEKEIPVVTEEAADNKQEDKAIQQDLKKEMESTAFEYGDLNIICQKCNSVQTLDTKIKGGIQFTVLCNTESVLDLKCNECDSHMHIRFTECEPPSEEEIAEQEKKMAEQMKARQEAMEAYQKEQAEKEAIEHKVTKEDVAANPGEDLTEGEVITIEKEAIVADEDVQEENDEGESV